jgi:hypothetical protein
MPKHKDKEACASGLWIWHCIEVRVFISEAVP